MAARPRSGEHREAPPRPRDEREGERWTIRQRIKNDLYYALIVISLAVVTRLPRRAVRLLGRALGRLAHRVLPRERDLAERRLAAGLGGPVAPGRARAAFLRAGEILADTLALLDPREPASRTLRLDPASKQIFADALAEGRGVVYVTAHLGSWERMAALLVEEGFPVATVARESYDRRLTDLYERIRRPRGVRSLYRARPGATAAIFRELRAGGAVGFLVDLPARVRSHAVPLFGALADMPAGAARIALRRRAALLVGTPAPALRENPEGAPSVPGAPGDSRPRVTIERVDLADLAADPEGERVLSARLGERLGARIAADPDAWLGLFAPSRRREGPQIPDAGGGPARHLRYLEESR
ncbi:MAG: lysophospholipid acyltransferase family protein [Byssovorax sp.]